MSSFAVDTPKIRTDSVTPNVRSQRLWWIGCVAAAILGGMLFAAQPTQVSAVAWIGGRTDSLCTLFVALFAWMLHASATAEPGGRRKSLLAISASCFFLALLAKEQAIALLPAAPLA